MPSSKETTRRNFLQAVSATPSLALLSAAAGQAQPAHAQKFTAVDLGPYFNTSPREFGSKLNESARQDLTGIPSGRSTLRGVPFSLGEGGEKKSWLLVRESIEIPLPQQKAGFVCLAQFCGWADACANSAVCENVVKSSDEDVEPLGARLADAVLVYADDSEAVFPMRRRFEVNSPSIMWGQLCFGALAHRADAPRGLNDALPQAKDWGDLQTAVTENAYDRGTG